MLTAEEVLEANNSVPCYVSEEDDAADELYKLIRYYRVFNPAVATMLSDAYLTLKTWE